MPRSTHGRGFAAEAGLAAEKAAQYAARTSELEQRVRVLEQIVTDKGVETAAQLRFLSMLGCHHAQGYHLGRPVPAAAIDTLLALSPTAGHEPGAPAAAHAA